MTLPVFGNPFGQYNPPSTTLKVDYDNELRALGMGSRLERMMRYLGMSIVYATKVKTKKGCHLYVDIPKKLDDKEIVFWQLYLGSDPERELFNWQRIKKGQKGWNVLFTQKRKAGKVISKEGKKERFIITLPEN